MKIVGTGCGPGMLTEEAIHAIRDAKRIYGSGRAIALVQAYINEGCEAEIIRDYRNLKNLPPDTVLLSTGDPMLAGLGHLNGDVIPGISSLQVAAARLHIPLARIAVVLAHGRDHDAAVRETMNEIARDKVVFLVADPGFDVPGLAQALAADDDRTRIALCEDLGYPAEQIRVGPCVNPPLPSSPLFSLLVGNF